MKKLSLFAMIMIMIVAACNKDDDVIKQRFGGDDDVPELRVRQLDANGEFDSETVTSKCQG